MKMWNANKQSARAGSSAWSREVYKLHAAKLNYATYGLQMLTVKSFVWEKTYFVRENLYFIWEKNNIVQAEGWGICLHIEIVFADSIRLHGCSVLFQLEAIYGIPFKAEEE